ncbi:hypothetical protein B5C34_05195 [Pacificimonas flava]|uniref:Bacteriophage tail tape measure N-terminal domain-containing protein n=2 Tax=Pacificimonas TaxID=1960290 RepID=A0A219B3J1_9SPHN|nr:MULTISPECIES: phage tail length tape measure family protein [Pacificimonas]MBZ6377386.1 phage tail length tape measure family protein [Pacificimonas aurantium]OWV32907.1 hypothetical protein B5C34_05195 [Pacificimonas flava]
MTDLDLRLRLRADGFGLVGQEVRQAAEAVESLGEAGQRGSQGMTAADREARQAGRSAQELGRSTEAATRSQRDLSEAARATAGAVGALDASIDQSSLSMGEQARLAKSLEQAFRGVMVPQNRVTQSAGQQRAMMQNLSFQIQDVSQQFALGVSPMTIFAQQGGQVAYAMQGLGGGLGRVAAFLSGPFGAAMLGGVTVVAALTTAFLQSRAAADDHTDATKEVIRVTTIAEEVERAYKAALGESVLTSEEAAAAALDLAYSRREESLQTLAAAQAALEKARADAELARIARAVAGGNGAGGSVAAATVSAAQGSRIAAAEERLALARKAVDEANLAVIKTSTRLEAIREDQAAREEKRTQREAELAERLADRREKAAEKAAEADIRAAERAEGATARWIEQIEKIADTDLARQQQDLDRLAAAYDPITVAAAKYREELEKIARFERLGSISAEQADRYRAGAGAAQADAIDRYLRDQAPEIFEENGARAGAAFAREALVRAEAIGQLIGGKAGDMIAVAVGLISGSQSGDFTALGGRSGGAATLLAEIFGKNGEFRDGLEEVLGGILPDGGELTGGIETLLNGLGIEGSLGSIGGRAAGGAAIGTLAGGALDLLGVNSSGTGASLGGAAGALVGGSVGALLGSVAGGLLGGLFGGGKDVGEATINQIGAPLRIESNDDEHRAAAVAVANAVTEGIQNIAQALGGDVGSGAVSVSVRNGNYRLDKTGRSLSSTKNGAIDFGQDAEGIKNAAIADLISDGAITGISAAVRRALSSSPDLEDALAEALQVKAIEGELNAAFNPFLEATADFERQAAERVRIAREYGFDVVEIERRNAEDRVRLHEQLLDRQVGSLRTFLDDLEFGSLAEGSATDQRAKVKSEIETLRADLDPTDAEANARLASLLRRFLDLSAEAGGTAGSLAEDRAYARAAATDVVSEAERQLAEAEKQTAQLDELNDQVAELNTIVADLRRSFEAGAFGGSGRGGYNFNVSAP